MTKTNSFRSRSLPLWILIFIQLIRCKEGRLLVHNAGLGKLNKSPISGIRTVDMGLAEPGYYGYVNDLWPYNLNKRFLGYVSNGARRRRSSMTTDDVTNIAYGEADQNPLRANRIRKKRFLGMQSQALEPPPTGAFLFEIPDGVIDKRFLGASYLNKRFLGASNIKRLQFDEFPNSGYFLDGGKRRMGLPTHDFLGKRDSFGLLKMKGGDFNSRYKIYPLFMYNELLNDDEKRAIVPTTDFLG